MKSLLLFSTRVGRWGAFRRPSGPMKQIFESAAALSFQEWPVITDIQRGTSRTRPRTDGVQHVRLIMMEQDAPGIAVAPVGGWTHAASVVPLEKRGSIWESL